MKFIFQSSLLLFAMIFQGHCMKIGSYKIFNNDYNHLNEFVIKDNNIRIQGQKVYSENDVKTVFMFPVFTIKDDNCQIKLGISLFINNSLTREYIFNTMIKDILKNKIIGKYINQYSQYASYTNLLQSSNDLLQALNSLKKDSKIIEDKLYDDYLLHKEYIRKLLLSNKTKTVANIIQQLIQQARQENKDLNKISYGFSINVLYNKTNKSSYIFIK